MSVVPDKARVRELTPDQNGGAQYGLEYIWRDSQDRRVRLRIHGPDRGDNVPLDSSSRWNEIYRIQISGRYQDMIGNLHHRNVHNPRSPSYNAESAGATHMIWPDEFNGL
ncbi:polymorphic toxin type 30 domain-containing protein [Streptomyces sp. NPDC012600]|uniref:polymorphic toxin type 30 domain-containing protein n=1 Tax=Streptomyces sp. NPDC012600 TaxID=3415005 RepID=UPI003C2B6551